MEPSLLWLTGTVMGVSWPIRYFTERALLSLARTAMVEVGAHKIFHGANIIVVGWHGYG